MKTATKKISILLMSLTLSLACGKNQFRSYEKEDAAQDAANALEDDNPDKAIKILESALETDEDNAVLISLLSAAYAQKYGVDILDLALAIADPDEEEEPSSDIAMLWPYLPDATSAALTGLDYSVALLMSIEVDDRTIADNFKLALLSTASISLRAKSFDLNEDGELSLSELLLMSGDDASAIINGILGASSAILAGIEGGENSDKAAEKISSIADDIANSEGSTDEEKLQNYFASQQANN